MRTRPLLLVTAAYLLGRAALSLVLVVVAKAGGTSVEDKFVVFDGDYYQQIALHGYPDGLPVVDGVVQRSEFAFFPGFPVVVRPLLELGLPFGGAAVLVNVAAGVLACLAFFLLVRRQLPQNVAVAAAMVWGVLPTSFVLTLAYAEALYCMWALMCLVSALRHKWLLAGTFGAVASFTRPSGVVLVVCLGVAVVLFIRDTGFSWRAVLAVPLSFSGFAAYMVYAARRADRLDVWFVTEREGWGATTDWGATTATRTLHYLTHPLDRPAATIVGIYVIALLALLVVMLRRPPPVVVSVFAILTVVLALSTSNTFSSIPRFTLPAMVGLLPPCILVIFRYVSGMRRVLLVAATLLGCATGMVLAGLVLTTYSTYPP